MVPPGADGLVVVGTDEGSEVVLSLGAQGVDGGGLLEHGRDEGLLHRAVVSLQGLKIKKTIRRGMKSKRVEMTKGDSTSISQTSFLPQSSTSTSRMVMK